MVHLGGIIYVAVYGIELGISYYTSSVYHLNYGPVYLYRHILCIVTVSSIALIYSPITHPNRSIP